ncbi:MAG: cytochrome b/b6 domain-containing protein [Myxococcota bacterium]
MSEAKAAPVQAPQAAGATQGTTLRKHPLPQRVLHWFNASSFLFLWLTGIGLVTSAGYRLAPGFYTDFMAWLFGGPTNLLRAHVGVGLLWFLVLTLAFVVDPWGLGLRFLRDLKLTSNDLRWFRVRVRAELQPDLKLPPQGAYNAGQKAFGWTVMLGVPAIGISGVLMIAGLGGSALVQWMVLLHLVAVGGVIAFFIVHLSMSTLMKEERPALRSMVGGDVNEDYARHHHQEWYEQHGPRGGEPLDPNERFGIPKAAWRLSKAGMQRLLSRPERPQWNPYAAGVLIGLAALAAFVLLGHGIGASGLFSRLGAAGLSLVAEDHVRGNSHWGPALDESLLRYWLLWMGLGTLLGGFLSAAFSGRLKLGIDKGDLISPRARILLALFGGALVGLATRFTRGCTSGQAISGGALLSVGAWVFVLAVFGGGFLTAFLLRRVWR